MFNRPRIPVEDQPMLASMMLNRTQAVLPPVMEVTDSELFDDYIWSPSLIVKLENILLPPGEE